jgi:FimV-like protein
MVVAIFQINPKAFAKNNINGLEIGQKLTLPTRSYFDKLSHLQAREILKEQNLEWKNLNQKTTKIAEKKKPKVEYKKNDVDKLKKEPELKNNAAEKAKADTVKEVEPPQPNENIIEDKVNNEIVEIEEEDFTSSIIDDEKPIIEEVIIDDPIEEPGNNKLIYVLLTIFALLGGVLVYLSKKRANFRKSPNPSFASQSFSSNSDAQNLSDDFIDQNDAFINSASDDNETQLNENIKQEVSESIERSSNSDVDLSAMTSVDAYIYKKNRNIN